MFEAVRLIGNAIREVHHRDAPALKEHGLEFNAALIFGGQIGNEYPRLLHIYAAGNFIETTVDTPYFHIGESKYGKPILDRVITRSEFAARGDVRTGINEFDNPFQLIYWPATRSGLRQTRRIEIGVSCEH